MMAGTRCNAAERAAFQRLRIQVSSGQVMRCDEPALGTVDQRLDIIIRRLGGRTKLAPLTEAERAEFEACRIS